MKNTYKEILKKIQYFQNKDSSNISQSEYINIIEKYTGKKTCFNCGSNIQSLHTNFQIRIVSDLMKYLKSNNEIDKIDEYINGLKFNSIKYSGSNYESRIRNLPFSSIDLVISTINTDISKVEKSGSDYQLSELKSDLILIKEYKLNKFLITKTANNDNSTNETNGTCKTNETTISTNDNKHAGGTNKHTNGGKSEIKKGINGKGKNNDVNNRSNVSVGSNDSSNISGVHNINTITEHSNSKELDLLLDYIKDNNITVVPTQKEVNRIAKEVLKIKSSKGLKNTIREILK